MSAPETLVDEPDRPEVDRVPRAARWLVVGLLAVLIVPGVIGFEAWPLTGWRLFSASRGETATRFVLEGVDAGGDSRLISPEELPLGYRHLEWRLRAVSSGPEQDRRELCTALAEVMADADPDIVELRIARDEQRLVSVDGDWVVQHDLDVRHSCGTEVSP